MKGFSFPLVALVFSATFQIGVAHSYECKTDWQSGNRYCIDEREDKVVVRGSNSETGNTWRQEIDRRTGNQRGTDAEGNDWTYNKSTGNYYNYGTGVTCSGRGSSRECY